MISVMVLFPVPYCLSVMPPDGLADESPWLPDEAGKGDMLSTPAHKKSLVQDEPTRGEGVLFGDL